MKKVAVVYSSKHGQTEKIARYMEDKLQERGFSTQVINVNRETPLSSEVDGVIYGGPVYGGKFSKQLIQWTKRHRATLDKLPTAFFTVSLNAADKHPEARKADSELIQKFVTQSEFAPNQTASIAGALKYRNYFWPMRLLMRRISRKACGDTDMSRNYEYTVWAQVDHFLSSFQKMTSVETSKAKVAELRFIGHSAKEAPGAAQSAPGP